jgi:hypothetical protein
MAITKNSSKSESWTIRIPNGLATTVRQKFPSGTGHTQIVIEAVEQLLGIDSSLPNSASSNDLIEVKLELDKIKSRLSALEHQNNISNKSFTNPDKPSAPAATHQEWINLGMIANALNVKPKSIADAVSKRGEPEGNDIIKFDMSGRTIHKKGKGLNALYQLQ